MKIKVRYNCLTCGKLGNEVEVDAREPEQGLMVWMQGLEVQLCDHHAEMSPDCKTDRLNDIIIPCVNRTQQFPVAGSTVH